MDDNWMVATTKVNDQTIVIRSRSALPDIEKRAATPVLVIIHWDYSDESDDMPPPEVDEAQEAFLSAIEASNSEDPWCIEAAALTGNGQREWRFYTQSADLFQDNLNEVLAEHPVYPLSFEVFDDPTWEALAEIVDSAKPN